MTFLLIALGGFLLGGAISLWRAEGRGRTHIVVAAVLLVGAVLAVASAILRM